MTDYFKDIKKGGKYTRKQLASLWGHKGHQGLARGVYTPSDSDDIVLFVTDKKQSGAVQYDDSLNGNELTWEGEANHGNDDRLIDSINNKEQVHLFFRDVHRSSFTYYGEVFLQEYERKTDDPSVFLFLLDASPTSPNAFDDLEEYAAELEVVDETEREALVTSRIGQGVFRKRLIEKWKGCAVTGLTNVALLRASHIKPWRNSTNAERLDPSNGLLLTPTLDHLFDRGFITFSDDGSLLISSHLTNTEQEALGVSKSMKLLNFSQDVETYMSYHRHNVFHDS